MDKISEHSAAETVLTSKTLQQIIQEYYTGKNVKKGRYLNEHELNWLSFLHENEALNEYHSNVRENLQDFFLYHKVNHTNEPSKLTIV